MAVKIERGEKFACVAITEILFDPNAPQELRLSGDLWYLRKPPVDVQGVWRQWLGSLKSKEISKSNLVILVKVHSATPRILNEENEQLKEKANRVFVALLLFYPIRYRKAYSLTGANPKGIPDLRQVGDLPDFVLTPGYDARKVGQSELQSSYRLAVELGKLVRFRRINRGLYALRRAIQDETLQFRIHQLVRALEGLVKPEIGKTRKQFIDRCQTLAKASTPNRKILGEIYDIRSQVEHLHDWDAALSEYPASKRYAEGTRRVRQAEKLTRYAYSKLLSEACFRTHFADDTKIDAFWKLSHHARQSIWGQGLDLDSIS